MNFLAPSHRIIYTLAAGALSATFTNLLMSSLSQSSEDDYYLGAFAWHESCKWPAARV